MEYRYSVERNLSICDNAIAIQFIILSIYLFLQSPKRHHNSHQLRRHNEHRDHKPTPPVGVEEGLYFVITTLQKENAYIVCTWRNKTIYLNKSTELITT